MWDEDEAQEGIEQFKAELSDAMDGFSRDQVGAVRHVVDLMRAKVGVTGWKRLCRVLVILSREE